MQYLKKTTVSVLQYGRHNLLYYKDFSKQIC